MAMFFYVPSPPPFYGFYPNHPGSIRSSASGEAWGEALPALGLEIFFGRPPSQFQI